MGQPYALGTVMERSSLRRRTETVGLTVRSLCCGHGRGLNVSFILASDQGPARIAASASKRDSP